MDLRSHSSVVCSLLSLVAVFSIAGCFRSDSTREKFDTRRLSGYGDLPGLRLTHHGPLKNELARLESEGATPALLMRRVTTAPASPGESAADAGPASSSPTVLDEQNAAVALDRVFARKLLPAIAQRCDELFPNEQFRFSAVEAEQVAEFRRRYESQQNEIRAAIALPACDFGYQHTAGLAADLWFLDAAKIAIRLEAFAAAEALAEERLDDVVVSLGHMFRLAAFLAQEKCAAARTAAAHLRIDTLLVLEAAAQHRAADAALHRRLHELVAGQLANWSDDADAWIGDRALGMHTYELVRDGYVLSLLHDDELARLRDASQILAFTAAAGKNVDADELFYLQTMRSIIDSCRRPYYERKSVFLQLRDRLERFDGEEGAPLVAEYILLADIEKGHVMHARDRSLCEGWAIALASAAGDPPPGFSTSPLTGKPYQAERQETRIVVRGAGDPAADRPIIVPITRRSPAEQARAAEADLRG